MLWANSFIEFLHVSAENYSLFRLVTFDCLDFCHFKSCFPFPSLVSVCTKSLADPRGDACAMHRLSLNWYFFILIRVFWGGGEGANSMGLFSQVTPTPSVKSWIRHCTVRAFCSHHVVICLQGLVTCSLITMTVWPMGRVFPRLLRRQKRTYISRFSKYCAPDEGTTIRGV